MTHGTHDEPAEHEPPSKAQVLLQASLERALTSDEIQQLRAATESDPLVRDDYALFELLRELRLEQRMARHDDQAWVAFQALAQRHTVNATPQATSAQRKSAWWTQWLISMRPGISAFATLVILLQTGGLVWLANRTADNPSMRGSPMICPAVLARFNPAVTTGELTRVLTQAQANVAEGPDSAGFYRLIGPQGFVRDAAELLGELATEVKPAPDCAQ